MNNLFCKDYERFTPDANTLIKRTLRLFKNYDLRVLWVLRKYQSAEGWTQVIWKILLNRYKRKFGIELLCKNIGGGVRLIHPYGITVNANAHVGKNVTLFKGVTIGEIEKGKRKGNPCIEDGVTIYANATICGNVCIGKNSIIASGAFVNFNVPQDSIVIGNPGVIHKKQKE